MPGLPQLVEQPMNKRRGDMTLEERLAARQRQKLQNYRRAHGYVSRRDPAPVIKHLRKLRRTMTTQQISAVSGVADSTITDLLRGKRSNGHVISYVTARNADAILAVQPGPGDPLVDPLGTTRRLQAMQRTGWTTPYIDAQLRKGPKNVWRLVHGTQKRIRLHVAQQVAEMYDKCINADPYDYCFNPSVVKRTITHAKRMGFAPAHCWDADSIDDPEAIPEWTGKCGMGQGEAIHYREKTVVKLAAVEYTGRWREQRLCEACITAKEIMRHYPRLGHLMGLRQENGRGKYERGPC